MNDKFDIISMVDDDINRIKNILKDYENDKLKMEKIFNDIFFKYINKIENISTDLSVVSPYSDDIEIISIYRNNIKKLLENLELFKGNGYSNENLFDFYIQSEELDEIDITAKFSDIIADIGLMNDIPISEKEEISRKLKEIEEICNMNETRKKKWEKLRPYVLWVSGKEYNIAIKIIPLFLKFR